MEHVRQRVESLQEEQGDGQTVHTILVELGYVPLMH